MYIAEPGGGPGGCDQLFEGKVVSPCTASGTQTGAMTGTKPPKRGHLLIRRNSATHWTEESYNMLTS